MRDFIRFVCFRVMDTCHFVGCVRLFFVACLGGEIWQQKKQEKEKPGGKVLGLCDDAWG